VKIQVLLLTVQRMKRCFQKILSHLTLAKYLDCGISHGLGIHIKNQIRSDQNCIIDNDDVDDDAYLIRELNGRLK
jgi:hypothetical protein